MMPHKCRSILSVGCDREGRIQGERIREADEKRRERERKVFKHPARNFEVSRNAINHAVEPSIARMAYASSQS